MSDIRDDMIRTLDRVVADTLTNAEREQADGGGSSARLWQALAGQGFTELGETGSELPYQDVLALVQRAAYHAAPVPLAETVLARRLCSMAGLKLPADAATVGPHPAVDRKLAAVPQGRWVKHVVVASDAELALVATDPGAAIHLGINQAGEARDQISLAKCRTVEMIALPRAARLVQVQGALIRAVQLTGALERTLEHTLTWVNERVQFGRPISKFQAIQHALAVMASEVAAARAAVDMAIEQAAPDADWRTASDAAWLPVAIAKSRAGEAAGKVANAAHAAFGAMGFTREHQLHYATRRLWAWRDEFGSEVVWQAEIGRHMTRIGGDGLWAEVTARD